jgi:photosystem II stability/assembly factor-like uncharacterized protein
VNCELARGLEQLRFASPSETWAIGCNFGPAGTGDYVVIHSKDAGHTWTEIPWAHQHATAPGFSFLDANRGWITSWSPAGDPRIMRTSDRGEHWVKVSGRSVQHLHFFDESNGFGANGTKFLRTEDAGRNWSETEIPKVRMIDRLFFLSRELGWAAGTDGAEFVVFRTADGGRTWVQSRSEAPERIANVTDLFFADSQRGWLITWHGDDGGTHLFSTNDGGTTWTRSLDGSFQGPYKWARVVRFVTASTGFVFETEEPVQCPGCGREERAARARSTLVYTSDGGAHWKKRTLPHTVYDCEVFDGDLKCSAGSDGAEFLLLTVHPK